MASTLNPLKTADTSASDASGSGSDSDGQARGGRRGLMAPSGNQYMQPHMTHLPSTSGLSQPAGQLLRGATDDHGVPTKAALMVGIKLDLEAEVHLQARVKGDIAVGLY